jgi:hypothetical protein
MRIVCWLIGHRWQKVMLIEMVWPMQYGYAGRRCERCGEWAANE